MTNREFINQMTNEELAEITVQNHGGFSYTSDGKHFSIRRTAIEHEIKWLQSEKETDNKQ